MMKANLKAAMAVGLMMVIGHGPAGATSVVPLDDGGWELVAHMSNVGGMFDGVGELQPGYSFGTFVATPTASTPDFYRSFSVSVDEILFMTGDQTVWGIANYPQLRSVIDARTGQFSPNIDFEIGIDGVISNVTGNVLSRNGFSEDPWISIQGDHTSGINNQRIVWGENNFSGAHQNLKNTRGGLNVYVRTIPEPSGVLIAALGGLGMLCRRRR